MDPSLVRKGKKIKSEDSKISKLHESSTDYDDSTYETNETDLNSNYNSENLSSSPTHVKMYSRNNVNYPPMPMYNSVEKESLLRYGAEILKYQGMCLQQRANILENEANILENEAKRRMIEHQHQQHQQYPFVQTVQYPTCFRYANRSVFNNPSPIKNEEPQFEPQYEPQNPSWEEKCYEKENNLSEQREIEDFSDDNEEDTDTPLDLTVKKTKSNLHTQASNMPRIFFSLNSNQSF